MKTNKPKLTTFKCGCIIDVNNQEYIKLCEFHE